MHTQELVPKAVKKPVAAWLLALDDRGARDPKRVGTKAAVLARLRGRGHRVPKGFVIPVSVTEVCLGGGEEGQTPALPGPLVAALNEALGVLGEGPVAVRSSGRAEDGAERSWAGQFHSVVGVSGAEAVSAAIRQVWASGFSGRARAYAGNKHIEAPAVLIQRLVKAETAGHALSIHPSRGKRFISVEAAPGLGIAVAEGLVEADRFDLERGKDGPNLVRRALGLKTLRFDVHEGELVRRGIQPEPASKTCLNDEQVRQVAELCLAAERDMGAACEIEWAFDARGLLYLLQARPITGQLSTSPFERPVLWTRRFSGERWNHPAKPLSWSLMQPLLNRFIDWPRTAKKHWSGTGATHLYRGVPYFNVTVFRHLLFRVPGFGLPRFVLELFPSEEAQWWERNAPRLPRIRTVLALLGEAIRGRRFGDYHFNPLTNAGAWERFEPRLEAAATRLTPTPNESPAELVAAVREGMDWAAAYVRIHILSLLFANLSYQILGRFLDRWIGDPEHRLRAALSAQPSLNKTMQVNKDLWRLAARCERHPQLREALRQGESDPDQLGQLPGGAELRAGLDAFLRRYGRRSAASWELSAPRWRDDPQAVLRLLGTYLKGGIGHDPFLNEEHWDVLHQQALDEVRAKLGRRGLLLRPAFAFGHRLTRRYMALREQQRFSFDALQSAIKDNLSALGEHLEGQGQIDKAGDVWWLAWDQLCRVIEQQSTEDLRHRVDDAKADVTSWGGAESMESLPVFLEGAESPIPTSAPPGKAMSGLGVSPGRVQGRVRVLNDLSESTKLQAGEILVLHAAEPSATPLFRVAGGLVLELGSLLSHAAVVARELGLPTVANIEGATRRLRDGDLVIVDGRAGRVWLVPGSGS